MSAMQGQGDRETVRDIDAARQLFETGISEPDPNSKRPKIGSVTAKKKDTHEVAGSLSFGVSEDADENLVVRTTQFDTNESFRQQHVALLLAYDLREHYGVEALHSSGYPPTPGGSKVIASLQRRGIMWPQERNG